MAAVDAEDHRDEDPDSLFLPADDDEDRRWNPVDEEEAEAEAERDMLGWAPSAMQVYDVFYSLRHLARTQLALHCEHSASARGGCMTRR